MNKQGEPRPMAPKPKRIPGSLLGRIMGRLRSFYCPNPIFDLLSEGFKHLLEKLGLLPRDMDDHGDQEQAVRLVGAAAARGGEFGRGVDAQVEDENDDWAAGWDDGDWDVEDFDPSYEHPEGIILVVTGETGAGKSRALQKIFRSYHNVLGDMIVSVTAPSPCTLMQLGRTLLPELGYPIQRDKKEHLIWEDVRRRLDEGGKRVLHIDEMQHLPQSANRDQQIRILNTIKSLVQRRENPLLLILSGTPDLADFLRTDGQVRRRCRFVEFERLQIPSDILPISCTLEDLVRLTPLRVQESVADDVAPRLIHAANNATGIAIELIWDAIDDALRAGDVELKRSHFERAYRDRISCPQSRNPFVVDNWIETDPTQILDRGRIEELTGRGTTGNGSRKGSRK